MRPLFYLVWQAANLQRLVQYNESLPRAVVATTEAIDPDASIEPDLATGPPDGGWPYGVGDVVDSFCEGSDGVTLFALHEAPYADVAVDPTAAACAAPPAGCDLVAGVATWDEASEQVTVAAPATTHGPVQFSITGINGTYVPADVTGGITFPTESLPAGAHVVYLKDAGLGGTPCRAEAAFNIVRTDPPGPPTGYFDSFAVDDVEVFLYYVSDADGRRVTVALDPAGGAVQDVLTAAQRGRAAGEPITQFCEGTTRVDLLASLEAPFAAVQVTPNSPSCTVPPLTLTAAGQAPAAAGGAGAAVATVGGGTYPVTVAVVQTGAQQQRGSAGTLTFALAPGSYTLRATDSGSPAQVVDAPVLVPALAVWGCTDPNATNPTPGATADDGSCVYAPPVVTPVFAVPLLNSLRLVVEEAPDNCLTFETLDNTLFCQQTRPGQQVRPLYVQKVARCDGGPLQVLTNYTAVSASVRRWGDGQQVATASGVRVQQLTGAAAPLAVAVSDTGDGWTRLDSPATADAALPATLLRAARVVLAGGAAGTYRVRSTGQDAATGAPYLVLQRPWAAPGGDVTASWDLGGPGFDVWEVPLDWAALPDGEYTVRVRATRNGWADAVANSEPLRVADAHPNTVLVEYRNRDNCFGMVWTTGITPRLRVDGVFFRRKPAGTLAVHRNSTNVPTVISSTAQRKILLETMEVPEYLHEKLFVACRLDWLRVNGVRVQAEEPYEAADQTVYPLTSGKVALEQLDWLGAGNGDDAGPVLPEGDNLLVLRGTGGFLKLRGA
ncbi:hypothetical protein LJ737_04200 [Hymenobacter sp. 15J16-1T3B]|uniref:hypothetical protein n=1 Tax=Hymenobacter sp. 15J16-1T3B TaxID=2886941 RepID=UPI001D119FCD|nr:hypothetical protein [Hymenobacter sp. 15J16-1T3B]MCC3156424.1 hypothetical protein [Hymenobacter sp. 15J16-1T3B]